MCTGKGRCLFRTCEPSTGMIRYDCTECHSSVCQCPYTSPRVRGLEARRPASRHSALAAREQHQAFWPWVGRPASHALVISFKAAPCWHTVVVRWRGRLDILVICCSRRCGGGHAMPTSTSVVVVRRPNTLMVRCRWCRGRWGRVWASRGWRGGRGSTRRGEQAGNLRVSRHESLKGHRWNASTSGRKDRRQDGGREGQEAGATWGRPAG